MIKQIFGPDELAELPVKGLEAQKIRALFDAYGTKYDFCRFYRQGNGYISVLDGSVVVCEDVACDYTELADFIRMQGFSDIFCSETAGKKLANALDGNCELVNLMKFSDGRSKCDFRTDMSLSDVFAIIREGFDIEFEPWYLDMSHRVRHGVTRCCTVDNKAALVIQHDINGEALLSQVASLKAHRGEGFAKKLVSSVAASLAPSEVFVVCKNSLTGFYEKCGFELLDKKCIITV